MTIHTRTAPGSLTLSELQERIQGPEDSIGVLRNIGLTDAGSIGLTDAGTNCLAFDDSELPGDDKQSTLQIVAGHPPEKPGFVLICFGPIFIEGVLQQVAVYR
jgi:hypothetical protein